MDVDADTDDPNAFHLGYFPAAVKVRPGDTVVYKSNFTGEPHTISFGSLITPAIEAVENATPEQLAADEPPPAFEPLLKYAMLPEGPGDANQVSANPCFVTSGELPADTTQPCAEQEPVPFTGKEVFYNSGFLADEEEFEVKLADDIAPGIYKGFCMLHFTEMVSTIEVVADDADATSEDEARAQAGKELEAVTAKAKEAYEKAKASAQPGTVLSGDPVTEEEERTGPPKPNTTVGLAEFTPAESSVAAGDSVTWTINGPHTITFNAPEDAKVVIAKGPDGNTHLVQKAVTPAKFNVPPPPEGEPEGPPPTVDLGSYDGTGFASTGLQFGGSFKVTFTKPGTYNYVCVVHPEMEGTVKVT
ncbi:MAG: cupredoxin domain-containing protein [Actinomycetota bacterium]